MDLALYHPETGYYARAAQRSGRAGDFFTSVDVGPVFGELLEVQFAEMADIVATHNPEHVELDLVEAGAGNGRLSADILRAARRRDPSFYERIRLHLVEASAAARSRQPDVLEAMAGRLVSSSAELPSSFEGILFANEDEAKALFRAEDFDGVIAGAKKWGGIAALTRSAKGCVIVEEGMVHEIPAAPVARVIDTTGAGDQFAAGFLYGLTHGKGLADCGRLGALAAAEVISHYGARPETSLKDLAAKAGLI